MNVISKANDTVLAILGKPKATDGAWRKMQFCVEQPQDDGMLLYHTLTKELLLLTAEEYANCLENEDLRKHWFVVPENTKDKSVADMVKWVLTAGKKQKQAITSYTIFPTTDCNARCFYCFELSRSRIPMDLETARKTALYIKEHCGGEAVKISWFGGEPLYNQAAMDEICKGLQAYGVSFSGKATTNAYLFDEAALEKAKNLWNIKQVQITLDGTEAVYNRIKAYIHKDGSPYQIVLRNMEGLLDAGIYVAVRLNMDLKNGEDLLALVDELAQRFGPRKNLCVYANHLFKGNEAMADTYSEEEWNLRGDMMRRLEEKIDAYGLGVRSGVEKKPKLNYCMADSGNAVTILPGGEIGLCEHFSETEFVGHIDSEGFDEAVVKSWKETTAPIPECATCFCYPSCILLKKCANRNKCFLQHRQERLRKIQRQMVCEYRAWENQTASDDGPVDLDC